MLEDAIRSTEVEERRVGQQGRVRRSSDVARLHRDQAVAVGKGQRSKEHGVKDAEHGSVGANAERQRQD